MHSIEIGNTPDEDQEAGFLGNVNDQVAQVCKNLSADPLLRNGFNAIGFSQGSQFLRAYVERCNSPPVYNLISIGGQHQGVYGFPQCPGVNYTLCEYIREMLDIGAYWSFIQNSIVQAQYWHNPWTPEEYVNDCIFLPDINNARNGSRNETYKQNMISLNKFVLVKFTEDNMVQPRESEWFGFYKDYQDTEVIPMVETQLYKEDWIGLKQLNESGRMEFLSVVGDHLQFTATWFIESIVGPYLNNTLS